MDIVRFSAAEAACIGGSVWPAQFSLTAESAVTSNRPSNSLIELTYAY